MVGPEKPGSSGDLGERLARARKAAGLDAEELEVDRGRQARELSMAWRIAIELVTAVVVCTGLGWAMDQWFGTTPWLMLALLVLGAAAGMNNAVRTALRMDAEAARRAGRDDAKGS